VSAEADPRLIVVAEPSGQPDRDCLNANIYGLQQAGFSVRYSAYNPDCGKRLTIDGVHNRANSLNHCLIDNPGGIVLCARGGYGASDLLDLLDWAGLKNVTANLVGGFSDISALHSAFYTRLGWAGLHGPMPGSPLWKTTGKNFEKFTEILQSWPAECQSAIDLTQVDKFSRNESDVNGTLFGGCFSVLSNLIGTKNFPESLAGHIVFLEDTNESLPQLLRCWNQWHQSGVLDGVEAVVLGKMTHRDKTEQQLLCELPNYLKERSNLAIFTSDQFGHIVDNRPLMTGASARIANGLLSWRLNSGNLIGF
jgi:muramoyltetrapeptide carboxypeptidase